MMHYSYAHKSHQLPIRLRFLSHFCTFENGSQFLSCSGGLGNFAPAINRIASALHRDWLGLSTSPDGGPLSYVPYTEENKCVALQLYQPRFLRIFLKHSHRQALCFCLASDVRAPYRSDKSA